jgi:hypothetical protein
MVGLESIMKALNVLTPIAGSKLLEKYNPKFKNYFSKAAAYGFTIDNAIDYLKNRFQESQSSNIKEQLQSREPSQMRPDEQIALNRLRQQEMPARAAQTIGSIGAGAMLAGLPGAAIGAAEQLGPEVLPKTKPSALGYKSKIPIEDLRYAEMGKEPPEVIEAEIIPGTEKGKQFPIQRKMTSAEKSRIEALKKYNEMKKEQKLLEKLQQDYERKYGPAYLPPQRTAESIQPFDADEKLVSDINNLFKM